MNINEIEYFSPPDNEAEKVFRCFLCKDWIHEGDKYYLISGLEYCKNCVEERTAESDDIEGYIANLEYHSNI